METESQAYEVPGQQLRWRAAQLQQQGYPFQVQPAGGGVYIVIVQQPPAVDPWAYQPPPRPRQAWPRFDPAAALRWALVALVAALLLGTVYLVMARSEGDGAAAVQEDAGSPWDWLAELRWSWEAAPDAAPVRPDARAPFRWPWDAAADSLADTAATVQDTVTLVSSAILAVLVLLIVLALVRKGRGR